MSHSRYRYSTRLQFTAAKSGSAYSKLKGYPTKNFDHIYGFPLHPNKPLLQLQQKELYNINNTCHRNKFLTILNMNFSGYTNKKRNASYLEKLIFV